MKILSVLFSTACLAGHSLAQGPPLPALQNTIGTNFLDHTKPLSGFFDKTFLSNNVPFFDSPDQKINDVFYYRLSILPRHLHYAIQGTGYTISEFITFQGYGSSYGLITAAAGHQIEEARWLRGTFYSEDNIQAYTRGTVATDPTSANDIVFFTHWIQYAALGYSNVTGNNAFIVNQLDGMIQMWDLWAQFFDANVGLYHYTSDFDAQENSLAGYVANAASGGANPGNVQREGPQEYRPSHNAYMIANADAIAKVAAAANNPTQASNFTTIANNLRAAYVKTLWDDTQNFFIGVVRAGELAAGPLEGREEIGMFPFRFGIGLESRYMNGTISALFDPEVFKTAYYPTTLEVGNKYYNANSNGCCWWQGQNWPYSTAHTVQSLAAMVRAGAATADQYLDLLHNYAITQYKNGVPYVAESHYPSQNAWSQDDQNDHHSQHYLHSTYVNNVITGIVGISPRSDSILEVNPIIPSNWTYFALENVAYHGLLLTILYDQNGTKYNTGAGLIVFANGQKIYAGAPKAQITLPAGISASNKPIQQNVAVNARGRAAYNTYPQITASYNYNGDDPFNAIDGVIYYDEVPANRWTNYDGNGAHKNDTLSLRLQRPRNITGVALAIFDDTVTKSGGGVGCPARILITDGTTGKTLADVTNFNKICLSNDINVVKFNNSLKTSRLNLNFYGQPNLAVGVAELQLWSDPVVGPVYFAADAFPSATDLNANGQLHQDRSAQVFFDAASLATNGGHAVVGMVGNTSTLSFSGIYSSTRRTVTPFITYKNNGTVTVPFNVNVNRLDVGTLSLPVTSGMTYANKANLPSITLLPGTNFLTLTGGAKGVYLEDITID